jgi:hypothetical protein
VSIAVIPLLAIRKTAMFTASSFAYFRPHALLKLPRRAIASWKNGISGMLLFAKGSARMDIAVSQIIPYGYFQATLHPLWKEHHFRMFRSTLLVLSPVIHGPGLLTLRQSQINLGDCRIRLERIIS